MSVTIPQNLFRNDATTFTVVKCGDDAVSAQLLQPLLDTADTVLGVAATYGEKCQLSSIAFSTLSQTLVVSMSLRRGSQDKKQRRRISLGKSLIQDRLLLNPQLQKYAFKMDRLAVALFLDLSLPISDAVDMLSVTSDDRESMQALMNAMGGEVRLNKENVKSLLFDTSESSSVDPTVKVALEAWAACRAAIFPDMSQRFKSLARIDTKEFPETHLTTVANISRQADRLDALKPTVVKNDVDPHFTTKKGALNLQCSRFPTRIRTSTNQAILIEMQNKDAKSQVTGRARKVNGRSAQIRIDGSVRGNKILSVTTIGKENLTCAESSRQGIILETLQHTSSILRNPFFRALWLPKERLPWSETGERMGTIPIQFSGSHNASQRKAIEKVLSDKDDDRIVMIQGPPGTGKTTVIAASVMSHYSARSSQNIWVASQSNVAVKNIAEKFINEKFRSFKILVSKDFHFDWHEHLYGELEPLLIRSDRFPKSIVEASRLLLDCKVILCTLSMFSNLHIDVFLRIIPVQTIILDEASQIESGDLVPILHRFHSTLSKLVFIGDDKQLPPYGKEDIPELRSVFEFPHLRKQAVFLNTQYRMPHVIGHFISQNVYGGKLTTQHDFKTLKPCRFVDVSKGRESKAGPSWINREEARVVVKLARLYESKKMSFRIITPYDAQRSHIEALLGVEKLNNKDKVFNVDSFQGNEDKHIIISVVRSHGVGFLKNERRTNVMLTRCKESMVICSSRSFLFGKASPTLVGKLAASLSEGNWVNGIDVIGERLPNPFP